MKSIALLFVLLTGLTIAAQLPDPDTIVTEKGDLLVQPIVHGTLVLSWNDLTIYVDPYGGANRFNGLSIPDIVLITDIHGDHLNQNTLNELDLTKAKLFVPQAVYDKLPEEMQKNSIIISNGENVNFKELNIAAIPMYNLPDDETSRHSKGRGNGYIITLGDKRLYISGDTEDIPEMRSLKNIDVAFVCMNLPFTMNVDQAASAVNEFRPSIVYPYHYRGREGLADVKIFKKLVSDGNSSTEVRLRNWYSE